MKRDLDLLNYLIEKTLSRVIKWKEVEHYHILRKRDIYANFINSNLDFSYIEKKAITNISPSTKMTLPEDEDIHVYYVNVKGMDVYLLEEINFFTSYPSRKYSIELIRIDLENKRYSFDQTITDNLSQTKNALEKLASIVSNVPVDESANADKFIADLIKNND